MSKIHFQLGNNNYVQISLPSNMNGDKDMLVGKAKVRVASLACSQPIKIHRANLMSFCSDVAKVYQTLGGGFSFESEYNTFSLRGEVTPKGQIRVFVKVGYEIQNHPDYTEWRAEAVFNCEPDVLERVLETLAT